MKTITIPDIHGSSIWKQALEQEADQYIFLGDYIDPKCNEDKLTTHDHKEFAKNLAEIIQFKKDNPELVTLLLGNHDFPRFNIDFVKVARYSDFNHSFYHDLYVKNKELFQIAYQYENYLWTHAGVSIGWSYLLKSDPAYQPKLTLAENLNNIWLQCDVSQNQCQDHYLHYCSRDRGGVNRVGGPLWVGKEEIYKKPIQGYHQIVGHNMVNDIKHYDKNPTTSITFTDCLFYQNKFHFLNL